MNTPVKVINGKLICQKQNHNDQVEMIVMDDQVPLYDRLLCLRCVNEQRQVSKYISIEEAQDLIEEKLYKLDNKQEEEKKRMIKDLNEFQNQAMSIRARVIHQLDQILRISYEWLTDIKNIGGKPDVKNLIDNLKLLQIGQQVSYEQLYQSNRSYYQKIDQLWKKKLMEKDDYLNCENILNNIQKLRFDDQQHDQKQQQNENIYQPIGNTNDDNKLNVKKALLVNTVEEEKWSRAIAFNYSGSIMVTGCNSQIKVWDFQKGKMVQNKLLNGHTNWVYCLVFSKKHNWFASGGCDYTIRCWKENLNKDWVSTKPGKSHSQSIICLILNNKEDQLISGSRDNTIKVWKVNCQVNHLEYDYTLEEKHTDLVWCISLNDEETALISCGKDQKIILWSKDQNSKWVFQHELIMDDNGHRICFISDNQIIWQQQCLGITHFLELKQGKLILRPELNLTLNQENDDNSEFPTIRNKKKQVIIQKHNQYVYFLKQQANGQLYIVSEPIDCSSYGNYGSLTENGEYLTIWNDKTKEFKVYNIIYE